MYAENWLQGRRWEDFEVGGASFLPPADGEDGARTDAGRCATVRHGGQGAREGAPAAPPMPEGRPLPPPGTPERARLEPQAGGIHYREEHRRGGGADQHHHCAEGRRKAGFLPQFHGCTSLGRVTVTAVPTPTWLLICSVPPCTAAMRWQRARPMPLPPCLRARDLSTM